MIKNELSHIWAEKEWLFLKEKAVLLPSEKILLLADVHFGKWESFQKKGIAVPSHPADFLVLEKLIQQHQPDHIIFLGDLFHSHKNAATEQFALWRQQFSSISMSLTEGNHDILQSNIYTELKIDVKEHIFLNNILLSHIPHQQNDLYNIAGHIHPTVKLHCPARQKIKLPCFHIRNKQMILPSFGSSTGSFEIKAQKGDQVIVISSEGLRYFE